MVKMYAELYRIGRYRSTDKKPCDNILGRALKFAATMRIEVRRSSPIKQGTEIVGNETKIKIVKNKVAPPFREALVDIMYGEGISYEGSLLEIGSSDGYDVVEKSGSWYSYNGEKLGQGKEKAKDFLKNNKEIAAEIDGKIRAIHNQLTGKATPAIPDVPKKSPSKDGEEK